MCPLLTRGPFSLSLMCTRVNNYFLMTLGPSGFSHKRHSMLLLEDFLLLLNPGAGLTLVKMLAQRSQKVSVLPDDGFESTERPEEDLGINQYMD